MKYKYWDLLFSDCFILRDCHLIPLCYLFSCSPAPPPPQGRLGMSDVSPKTTSNHRLSINHIMHLCDILIFLLLLSIPFLYFFLNLVLINRRNGRPACPSLMCFFNRGDTEGTNSSKVLCLMFVYVLFYVNLCHDWFCGLWIICGLMTCVQSK